MTKTWVPGDPVYARPRANYEEQCVRFLVELNADHADTCHGPYCQLISAWTWRPGCPSTPFRWM
jgi:hypothetical protein